MTKKDYKKVANGLKEWFETVDWDEELQEFESPIIETLDVDRPYDEPVLVLKDLLRD